MSPRGLILLGTLVAAVAVAIAALGAAVQGPRIPACQGAPFAEGCATPARLGGLALHLLALVVGLLGGLMVAVGLGRLAALQDEEEAVAGPGYIQGRDPPSPPR